jgi:hypothetical protein
MGVALIGYLRRTGLAVEHEHCLRGVSISATFFAPSFLTERISSSFSSAALF